MALVSDAGMGVFVDFESVNGCTQNDIAVRAVGENA